MKSAVVLLLFLAATGITAAGQSIRLNNGQISKVKKIIDVFGTRDKAKIAGLIQYPLNRAYPLKDVKDRNDFIKRFDEIFDKEFVRKIADSKIADWSEVGWRGVMFDKGSIWLNHEGRIKAVNYQSAKEKSLLVDAIRADKKELPEYLRNFEEPVYLIVTKNYKIRIDQKSENSYRYASWTINSKLKNPDLVIENGILEFQGSGGNHIITFRNAGFEYIISINKIGAENDPDAVLEVLKHGKVLLKENGEIKRN